MRDSLWEIRGGWWSGMTKAIYSICSFGTSLSAFAWRYGGRLAAVEGRILTIDEYRGEWAIGEFGDPSFFDLSRRFFEVRWTGFPVMLRCGEFRRTGFPEQFSFPGVNGIHGGDMIQRYSRPGDAGNLDGRRTGPRSGWKIEMLASEALVAEGIPCPPRTSPDEGRGQERASRIPAHRRSRPRNWRKTLNHDVIRFTTAVARQINDPASRWLHFD